MSVQEARGERRESGFVPVLSSTLQQVEGQVLPGMPDKASASSTKWTTRIKIIPICD